MRCTLKLACLVALSLTFIVARADDAKTASGYAVPIGGALRYDNEEVWSRLVTLAGGRGARFVVFATAASDPAASASRIVEALQRHGAQATHIPVAPRIEGVDLHKAVRDPKWVAAVDAARGVFFSGGAQERIVDTFAPDGQPTPLLEAVRNVQRRGGVIAGTSAGAAIMSTVMFRDASDVMRVLRGTMRTGKEIDRGLGFVGPRLFIDQHFLARGRIGRMLPLMAAHGYELGLGVEEDSAAIVQGDRIEVLGSKGALLVDLREATQDPKRGAFNLRNARVTYLARGDRFDLSTGELIPAAPKREHKIDPHAASFQPYFETAPFFMNILGDNTIVQAMTNLLDSPLAEVRGLAYDPQADGGAGLGFEFRLHKGADTVGWFASASGGEDYTVANVYLDVTPVRVADPLYSAWPGAVGGSHSAQP